MNPVAPWRRAALSAAVAVMLAALVAPVLARAQDIPADPRGRETVSNFLAADATEVGVISLFFFGAEGAPVQFFERVGAKVEPLASASAPAGKPTLLKDAVTWDCARLTRRFLASADLPNGYLALGAYSVRTPSCAKRFELQAPRLVAPGAVGRIRILDTWGTGDIAPRLCVRRPKGKFVCRSLRFRRAVGVQTRRFRADREGRWRVELRIRGHKVKASSQVGGEAGALPKPPPTLLATGDSTMQGIDSFLSDELGSSATVKSDVRPGSGISKSEAWLRVSREQARRTKPKVTVITIGAADGATMPTPGGAQAKCCDEPWIAEYERRVRIVMGNYLRGGKGRVFWLTLPKPRGPTLVADAINLAILRAAKGMKGVAVLRSDLIFTPDGFRDVIRYRGRDVRVREDDGIHLNVAGTAIAARAIVAVIRATKALG